MYFLSLLPAILFTTVKIEIKFSSPNISLHKSFSCANSLSSIEIKIKPDFFNKLLAKINLFLRKTPVEKRKDDRYGISFLTCESKAKKDTGSFVKKYSNIN